ncbi:DNA-directed DNA polymerase [Saliniradius amylolyticus]|uniref:DNA polymerase III subunit epsilon n=1 Tax=Saliniradius amylolyticus TaxID=2183582 RepID=A0A2S2E2V4_9ALTE|nr:DNA polymerase III subunit epsilon [Saliniradius amylolyticus]AWL11852.1 DNA-directed DNA polymerase [Saliniradius amylolyticus]
MARQIVLDTETTGIDPKQGHRIIEIGCVEMINRRLTGNNFHVYIHPEREVEQEAIEVHGITNEYLADKPKFHAIADDFVDYIRGAELVIHNAPFDVGFMNHEFGLLGKPQDLTNQLCQIRDTLTMARELFPGQRNSLDALCKRYGIDNSHRTLHGALLDAEILADVYLHMTGGQTALNLHGHQNSGNDNNGAESIRRLTADRNPLKVIRATADELEAHEQRLDLIEEEGGQCIWRQ